jgi:hypothetical protein
VRNYFVHRKNSLRHAFVVDDRQHAAVVGPQSSTAAPTFVPGLQEAAGAFITTLTFTAAFVSRLRLYAPPMLSSAARFAMVRVEPCSVTRFRVLNSLKIRVTVSRVVPRNSAIS